MTQIDELVKRLRGRIQYVYGGNGNLLELSDDDCIEAAAELTRLRERNAELEKAMVLYREAVRIDPLMEGPRFAGANSSALRRAWEHDRAAIAASESVVKSEDSDA